MEKIDPNLKIFKTFITSIGGLYLFISHLLTLNMDEDIFEFHSTRTEAVTQSKQNFLLL